VAEPIWEVMWQLKIKFAAHYIPHLRGVYLVNCANSRGHIEKLIAEAHLLEGTNGQPSESAYGRVFPAIAKLEQEGFTV
jgi:hypothetical protein